MEAQRAWVAAAIASLEQEAARSADTHLLRLDLPAFPGVRRRFDIPLTEVAKPGPDVVGSAGTWQLLLDTYATWQEVLDANASWADVAQLIGDESDVIVGP